MSWLKPLSEVNYVLRNRESVIDNLVHGAKFEKFSTITSG